MVIRECISFFKGRIRWVIIKRMKREGYFWPTRSWIWVQHAQKSISLASWYLFFSRATEYIKWPILLKNTHFYKMMYNETKCYVIIFSNLGHRIILCVTTLKEFSAKKHSSTTQGFVMRTFTRKAFLFPIWCIWSKTRSSDGRRRRKMFLGDFFFFSAPFCFSLCLL